MKRKTALVIAPGRGTYNREELGYLARHHRYQAGIIAGFDAVRSKNQQETVTALDSAARFSVTKFTRGDNASALIHACAYADFQAIDREVYDIVALTGNSMGWYIALACAGALEPDSGFALTNTMGTLMHEALIGGQTLYPCVDGNWQEIPGKRSDILSLIEATPGLYLSIKLGGMIVLAGDEAVLKTAEARLVPVQDRFPMRLPNHAAFHTPMQAPVAQRGQAALPGSLIGQPDIPLIDGRGHVWLPHATDTGELRDYTLNHQVVEPYDFTAAVQHGVREFAPEAIIILGPGKTLGSAVAQSLIGADWRGITSKRDFSDMQSQDPFVLSMGIEEQRRLAVGNVKQGATP